MEKIKVGIVGCGKISGAYFKNLKTYAAVEVAACSDLDLARAAASAEEYGIPKACSVAELLADPAIDLVINLTIPAAHADVCIQALEAGKHVYVEKPLAVTREEGQAILAKAAEKQLLVGSAPDTFLGGGIQTCIKLIDDGWIGTPVAATAFMMGRGHEHWHPDPEFYYAKGGGPMFDMGPYYLTALIAMLGPISRITGSAKVTFPERTITSEKKYGKTIQVDTPTHVAGIMDFHSGVIGTIITSFDVFGGAQLPRIEVYGSLGTLSVPDPNTFGGPVMLKRHDAKEWKEIPLTHGYTDNSRGLGVLDMAYAIRGGRINRTCGQLAYHVLEAMHAFHDASDEGKHYAMKSICERPAPMSQGLVRSILD
ncbi:Gfo/Idh/MocA family protein [Paenibacillus allorhizosphaerae]|uniref:Inositol 2-dehydrogenase/D-chiro-inositol 3-dehydrogenase n=1 Tax=Paenibacillus allorhizosphaerae TaxID=2849866 RepID=A0ABM8VLW1_9BACL|nr:Gfo/Idh/MocA family oxidoreductase [Paenibacillus allorhizosphaerae]CAG7649040.1 Inositol 2-dehydrogenase/D-chiro-inositol 3-dehydrogenase [Paenibacillus allorhizosphaerae]